MRSSQALLVTALAASVNAHGLVVSIQGANGVTMPGLSVADGTPRDCSSNGCGSQADTAIIRDSDISSGRAGPLGRTQGNGPISAETMIRNFMGRGTAPTNNGASDSVGVEDDIPIASRGGSRLGGLFGGGGGGSGTSANGPPESSVAASSGQGASRGLPTASDSGLVTMTFRQINQDGAGPLTADIDGTSGGTEESAFQRAEIVTDVPGFFGGLSLATNTEFPLEVQMPPGMTCDASVGGADNVCIVRVRNSAIAGPFGGSAAFTQSPEARKRALAFRLKKRMEIRV
ncbi:MAS1 protein [Sodiomyces alkalinus F11]|uniref:MAS1 protein n=1 Tax=Sodiomyces alkalinus (strain CBS 110278 / VKM F-3762 / F11) TaxID=1314773 RepID=A0A3N2Q834_SODAK|nr:MAS1 protein [Sodiomyces alkalinus F11]ROT42941.1 MAS1 protein [Sodiomyces alkalinus F11]